MENIICTLLLGFLCTKWTIDHHIEQAGDAFKLIHYEAIIFINMDKISLGPHALMGFPYSYQFAGSIKHT